MPIRDDLVIPTGRAWAGPFWALVGDQGQAVSLAGRKIHAQVRPAVGAADVLYEWSTDEGNVVVSDVQVTYLDDAGTEHQVTTAAVSLMVPARDSAAWRWTLGVYDVLVIDPDNPDATYAIVEESAVRADRGVTDA
ncbi:hypothetical protein [Pseudonocardia sp. D17]|uniref:hypothetical protein n=1 Tax=Pseudonocardia sp. D17 TaxID=882661 RepID=UPI002B3BD26D|nr:hypothetical protein PSD17_39270 [Pseudonocardia sp. D17]